jgi:hypothetical protein
MLVGAGVYGLICSFPRAVLNDGDTFTHILVGRWIIEHGAIPFQDPFTFTARGGTWVPHEWLAEIALGWIYGRLGWGGVVAATALAAAAAFALLTHALAAALGPRRGAIGAALALMLSVPHILARPHVLAWPLLVVWMAQVVRARDADRVPPLWLLPLMVLWANLHAGFIVGLGFAALLAAEATLAAPSSERLSVMRRWCTFIALAAASALISPNGLDQYLLTVRLLGMGYATSVISEWHGADFSTFQPVFVWIALAILGGFMSGLRLPWPRLAMLLLLLYEALGHVRHMDLLAFIAPLLVAAPLATRPGSGITQAGRVDGADPGRRRPRGFAALATVFVAVAVGFAATVRAFDRHGLRPPGAVAPVAALEAVRAAGLTGNVLNSLRFGGYLAFIGIPPFIDGRADLFGDSFIQNFHQAITGETDGLPKLLDDRRIAWAILEPQTPAIAVLAHLPAWERIHADRYAVVFRRKQPVEPRPQLGS